MTKTIKNNKHFINDIPSNWFSSKLKYLMTILPKSDIPAGLGKEEGIYPFYTSSQLLTKRIDTCLYEGNSITMGTGGLASINYVDVPFATSTDCFNFTCGEMTKFIYYYLYSLLDVISNLGFEGMGLKHLQKDFIENLEIFFPSIEEQQKIVSFLDNQIVNINKLITETKKSIKLYEEYRKSLITETVNYGINNDSSFPIIQLKYITSYNNNSLSESTDENFEFDYIDIGSVSYENGIEEYQNMKFKDAPSRARRIVEEDDVIVSTVRTYLKAIAVIPSNNKPIIVSTGFITLKAKKDVLPKFLKYLALQEKFISQVQSRSCGVSYPAINSSDVISIKVPVPTIEIQKEIVDFLEQKCDFINNIIKEKEIFINQLEEYKKSLIYEYVTGKKQLN